MSDNVQISIDEFQKRRKRHDRLIASFSELHDNFDEYEDIYFMDSIDELSTSAWDKDDIKTTTSSSGRNKVVGEQRLLKTSQLRFVGESKEGSIDNNKLEDFLRQCWQVSGELKRASLLSDMSLSAALYGPVIVTVESVADLITITRDEYDKALLEEIARRTPLLFSAIPATQSFPTFGPYGLRSHLREYESTAEEIKQRWGDDLLPGADWFKEYTVRDEYGPKYRVVYLKENDKPLYAKEHGMKRIPIAVSYAGGSSLFTDPDKQLQSFLYAANKGELHKRENLALTTFFTSLNARGAGPLFAIPEDELGPDGQIYVNHAGAFRYVVGNVKMIDDKAYDKNMLEAINLLGSLMDESTMYSQTLGESLGGNKPFSSLALLSRSGQLPLQDPIEAITRCVKDISRIGLDWVRNEGLESDIINPQDIPEDIRLTVRLSPKLPQDDLKNAQVAAQIGDKVSDEWIHTNLLQIDDSDKMQKDIFKEQAYKAIFANMLQDPNFMMQMVAAVTGQGGQPQGPMPQGQDQAMAQQEAMMQQQRMAQEQAIMQGQANAEQPAMTEPMTPRGEELNERP